MFSTDFSFSEELKSYFHSLDLSCDSLNILLLHNYLKYWAFGPKNYVFILPCTFNIYYEKKLMQVLCGAIYWEILYSVATVRKQYVYSY